MPNDFTSSSNQNLVSQIADYGVYKPSNKFYGLSLYSNIEQYKSKHFYYVKQFEKHHSLPVNISKPDTADPQYFRKLFVNFVQNHPLPKFQNFSIDRINHPEQATISTKDFLGSTGSMLYKLALEEETNSSEFREAIMIKSTSHYDGPKWLERPIVIVSGPSGCGKSVAALAAVEKISQLVPKDLNSTCGNDIISIDGGIIRDVSQMRKLAIRMANIQGYSGISDLHDQSSILNQLKSYIKNTAIRENAGLVIPETFSKSLIPFNEVHNLIPELKKIPNGRIVYSRVVHQNKDLFKNVVHYMGSRRAWKTSPFKAALFGLNSTVDLCESKAYRELGFKFGLEGSKQAEVWFRSENKNDIVLHILNDLILLKPNATSANGWDYAQYNDPNVLLISKSIYDQWLTLPPNTRPDLNCFKENNPITPIIKTSGELDYENAKNHLLGSLAKIRDPLKAVCSEIPTHGLSIQKYLLGPIQAPIPKTITEVQTLYQQLFEIQSKFKNHVDLYYLKKTLDALKKMETEFLIDTPPSVKHSQFQLTPHNSPSKHSVNTSNSSLQSIDYHEEEAEKKLKANLSHANEFLFQETHSTIHKPSCSPGPCKEFIKTLHACALAKAKSLKVLHFDPQGRILIHLNLRELGSVTFNDSNNQSTPEITISLDVKESPELYAIYTQQYGLDQLSKSEFLKFESVRGSIIPLQTELYFHLALTCRTYTALSVQRFPAEQLQHAHYRTMRDLQVFIIEQFKDAMTQATTNGLFNSVQLIKNLDQARKKLSVLAHQKLASHIIELTGNIPCVEELKRFKHQAELITASTNDLLHTNHDLQQSVWISGSSVTAHNRGLGIEHLADRQIKQFSQHTNDETPPRIQIRVPSLDVKTNIYKQRLVNDQEKISDICIKLIALNKKYAFAKSLPMNRFGYQSFIYNLHTAINDMLDNLQGKNKQSAGAAIILKGVHEYNAQQLSQITKTSVDSSSQSPQLCFLQNISVNGFGQSLNFKGNDLRREATLMAEMALCNQLIVESDLQSTTEVDIQFQDLLFNYKQFLAKPSSERDVFFVQSPEGQNALRKIQAIKKLWVITPPQKQEDSPNFKNHIQQVLKIIMARNLHYNHQFAKLIQVLSVFTEHASISGCKSGNERAQSINGRVALLESISHNPQHPVMSIIKEIISSNIPSNDQANSEVQLSLIIGSITKLQHQLDTLYNVHLQSAVSLISLVDQGASAKVQTKKGLRALFDRNYAEEPTLDNLQQSRSSAMQAHKGLGKNAAAAVLPLTYWNYMKSKVGIIGALLSYLIYPLALWFYKKYLKSFNESLLQTQNLHVADSSPEKLPSFTSKNNSLNSQSQSLNPRKKGSESKSAPWIEHDFSNPIPVNLELRQKTQKSGDPSVYHWSIKRLCQSYNDLFAHNSLYKNELAKLFELEKIINQTPNSQHNIIDVNFYSEQDLGRYAEILANQGLSFVITDTQTQKILAYSKGNNVLFDGNHQLHIAGSALQSGNESNPLLTDDLLLSDKSNNKSVISSDQNNKPLSSTTSNNQEQSSSSNFKFK